MKQPSLKSKPFLKFLTESQLEKLNTKRLLGVLNSIRAVEHDVKRQKKSYGMCCSMCKVWILDEEEYLKNVKEPTAHLTSYKDKIKRILAAREHIK
jgi:hypothetical protein